MRNRGKRSPHLADNFIHHEGREGLEEDMGRNAGSTYPSCLLLLPGALPLLPAAGSKRFFHHEGTLTTFGFALALPALVKRWTLTAFRSGLNVSNLVRCFKSGCDLL